MDVMYKTEQCEKKEYDRVKELIMFTTDNISSSLFKLDMMVNPNDRLPYNEAKYQYKVFKHFLDEDRLETEDVKYNLADVQELLLRTMNEINKILHDVLLRSHLLNFWD
jgi:thiamine pyrophosphokinase